MEKVPGVAWVGIVLGAFAVLGFPMNSAVGLGGVTAVGLGIWAVVERRRDVARWSAGLAAVIVLGWMGSLVAERQ